jgi:hypothetical protein
MNVRLLAWNRVITAMAGSDRIPAFDLAERLMAEKWPRLAKLALASNDHFPAPIFLPA